MKQDEAEVPKKYSTDLAMNDIAVEYEVNTNIKISEKE